MKLGTLVQLVPHGFDVNLTRASLKTVGRHNATHDTFDSEGLDDFLDDIMFVDTGLYDKLTAMNARFQQETKERERAEKAAEEAQKAASEEKQQKEENERRQQIVAAIVEASKQQGLSPFALIRCGCNYDDPNGCPEPVICVWLKASPESEYLNFEHIVDAYCTKHWRVNGHAFPVHWHDAEFMHPAIATVVLSKRSVEIAWTRHPEKFGKSVQTAKDSLGSTIKKGALVVYQRPTGNPRTSQATEQSVAAVMKIWKVGTIKVLQVRRIIENQNGPLKLSPRLSTRYANKVVALSEIPRKFRKVLKGKS